MFGLCFLSALNGQEEGGGLPFFATLDSEVKCQMESSTTESLSRSGSIQDDSSDFPPVSFQGSDVEPESSQPSPSAAQDILAQAFAGVATLTELNDQHKKTLQETLRATDQNTRATELLGQVVTAQSESLIDLQKQGELTVKELAAIRAELAASRLIRESERETQRKKDEANRLATHQWYCQIRNQSDRNEALALIGGALFGAWFACQMMLDNLNGGSSGHH